MPASKPQARATPRSTGVDWFVKHPAWLLALAAALILLPFLGKPFNIDDPLFVWAAQQIHSHPFDPYGFHVNWYGFDMPFSQVTKNPPLAPYYLAAFGSIFGWSEIALHSAMILPAIAAILGAYRLASRFCKRPLLAGFLTLLTPVFLVSANTVMCDVLMLAFWVWALVFWIEGTERKRLGYFVLAAFLIALAALTKYFGVCLIPLVAAWSIARKRSVKEWLVWLVIPVAVLIAYQLATRALYGRGLLADAGSYAVAHHAFSAAANLRSLLIALAFAGGCLAVTTFSAPLLWPGRQLLIGGIASVVIVAVLSLALIKPTAAQLVQIILWSAGGISLLALTGVDLYRSRGADSLLLACWVFGTFIFTAFFNWIINGRSLLPITIPAAILVARQLERRAEFGGKMAPANILPVAVGALLAIWVAAADYSLALAPKIAARAVQAAYGKDSHRLWFQGHWGFQYYMEKAGATPLDVRHPQFAPGDRIAVPSGNSNVYRLKNDFVTELEMFAVPVSGWISTLNAETGAGFYASVWGPLPFAFGPVPPQTVTIFTVNAPGANQNVASRK